MNRSPSCHFFAPCCLYFRLIVGGSFRRIYMTASRHARSCFRHRLTRHPYHYFSFPHSFILSCSSSYLGRIVILFCCRSVPARSASGTPLPRTRKLPVVKSSSCSFHVVFPFARSENDFIVAPSLKGFNLFRRVRLVIYHHIWIIIQIPESPYPI